MTRRHHAFLLAVVAGLVLGGGSALADDAWTTVPTRYVAGKDAPPFHMPLAEDGLDLADVVAELPVAGGAAVEADGGGDKVGIDWGRDGRVDQWISGTSDRVAVTLTHGDRRVPYQLLVTRDADGYVARPGCYRLAKAAGVQLALIDADADGRFDGVGDDMIAIGRRPELALPLGRVVAIGDALWELKVRPDGTELSMRPWRGETGQIDLRGGFGKAGRGTPEVALVTGPLGTYDALAGRGPATVPAGEYAFRWGTIAAGPRRAEVAWDTTIVARGDTPARPTWGAPFAMHVPVAREGNRLTVMPLQIDVTGRGGESYDRFAPSPLSVRLLVRRPQAERLLLKRSGGGLVGC